MAAIKNYQDIVRAKAVDRSLPFAPTGTFPLDARTFFDSLVDAQKAAQEALPIGALGDTTYYHGQLIGVLEYPNGLGERDSKPKGVATYYVIQPDGTLSPLGGGGGGESLGLEFKNKINEPETLASLNDGECVVWGLGECQDLEISIPDYAPNGDKVVAIWHRAFKETGIKKIILPDTIKTIGTESFAFCNDLTSIDLGKGLQEIGPYAFQSCNNLARIKLPDSVTTVRAGAFASCTALIEIELSESLITLERLALTGCIQLKHLIIPDSCKKLSESLCKEDISLTTCTLPIEIDLSADLIFANCPNLEVIYYAGSLEEWSSVEKVPKNSETWSLTDGQWFLANKPITIVYDYANTTDEINVKINSEVKKLQQQAATAATNINGTLDNLTQTVTGNYQEFLQKTENVEGQVATLSQNTTNQFETLNQEIATHQAKTDTGFEKITTTFTTASSTLISFEKIKDEDDYCLIIDPSVFN